MAKRISITLLFTVVIAIVALFAAAEVEAEYTGSFDAIGYTWFIHLGCRVEISIPFPEVIDCATGKCSKYTYMVTCPTSHSDILIRRDMASKIVQAECDGYPCTWETKCDGTGESSTGFGKYLIWNVVGKWNYGWSDSNSHTLSLILTGDDLGRDPTDFLIKHGQVLKFGPIQGPAPSCVQVDPNQPLSTESYIQVGPVTLQVLYNAAGESYDVTCEDCTIEEIELSELKLEYSGQEGTVIWIPFDEPIGAEASPGCYYYRTRTGKLKKICP